MTEVMPEPKAAVVCGLGGYTPPQVVTNDDLAGILDTSDKWIRSRTGISRRHVVEHGVATSHLAVEAGRRALANANVDEADAVVLATATPDQSCPATAPQVASQLGLKPAAAFDISAVCSGFIYALAAGTGLIAAGIADRVVVIGADAFSLILNPADRTTRAVFGDGAGAVVLRSGNAAEPGALGPFILGSDGSLADLITVPAGGSRQPLRDLKGDEAGRYLTMQGQAVYRHAVSRMTSVSIQALEAAGRVRDEIDWLVCHQANQRILAAVADRLGIPRERCLSNIAEVGNTAAASIPLALADGNAEGMLRTGQNVLLTAFGGGLTWGSVFLRWPDLPAA